MNNQQQGQTGTQNKGAEAGKQGVAQEGKNKEADAKQNKTGQTGAGIDQDSDA